jgi:hypothetical protein
MTDNVTVRFIEDSAHGWALVTRDELAELGIADEISPYSYQRGPWVALEEDCDLGRYMLAQEARGVIVTLRNEYQDGEAYVRRWQRYQSRRPVGLGSIESREIVA